MKILVGNHIYIKRNLQLYYAWLLTSIIWFRPIRTMLISIGDEISPGGGHILSLIAQVLFFICLILPVFLKGIFITKDVVYVLLFLLFSLSVMWLSNIDYIAECSRVTMSVVVAFCSYWLVGRISDWEVIRLTLYKSALICLSSVAIATLFFSEAGTLFSKGETYNQFMGVITAPAAVIAILAYDDTRKKKYLMVLALACCLIIYFGARSPLLCCLLTVLAVFIKKVLSLFATARGRKKIKGVLIVGIIFSLLGICLFSFVRESAKSDDSDWSHMPGGRIIYFLTDGNITYSSGRNRIYGIVAECIMNNPMGTGMLTDRRLISVERMRDDFMGSYPHNFMLEFILQYGLCVGMLLNVMVAWTVLRGWLREKMNGRYRFAMYCVCFGLGTHLVSGTIWECSEFWALMGMYIPVMFKRQEKDDVKSR